MWGSGGCTGTFFIPEGTKRPKEKRLPWGSLLCPHAVSIHIAATLNHGHKVVWQKKKAADVTEGLHEQIVKLPFVQTC